MNDLMTLFKLAKKEFPQLEMDINSNSLTIYVESNSEKKVIFSSTNGDYGETGRVYLYGFTQGILFTQIKNNIKID